MMVWLWGVSNVVWIILDTVKNDTSRIKMMPEGSRLVAGG